MKISDELKKKLHDELDKQIEVLVSLQDNGGLCIIDQSIVCYEDITTTEFAENIETQVVSSFVLDTHGDLIVDERVHRIGRCGEINEQEGEWKEC